MIPYGVHYDMTAETYHKLPGASASKLKAFHRTTPAHAKVKLEEPFEQTPFTIMGTLVHDRILEGGQLAKRLAIQPEEYEPGKKWTYNATVCKKWKREQLRARRIILKESEHTRVKAMTSALIRSKAFRILKDAKTEVSVVAYDSTNQIPFRCRKDIIPKPSRRVRADNGELVTRFLADIKVVSDITDRGLERNSYDRGLHVQAAVYLAVWNSQCASEDRREAFVFIFIENEAPFSVRIMRCSERFLEQGRTDMARYLKLYAECTRTGIWPGYPSECQTLDLPGYVRDGE